MPIPKEYKFIYIYDTTLYLFCQDIFFNVIFVCGENACFVIYAQKYFLNNVYFVYCIYQAFVLE